MELDSAQYDTALSRAVYPHSLYANPDPAVFLNADPDPAVFLNADPDQHPGTGPGLA